jgi:hypothetical protein
MARGDRGEPRDHRREDSRITENDLDPSQFELVDGRLTLKLDTEATRALLEEVLGAGLEFSGDGTLQLKIGATLGYDRSGRLAVTFTELAQLTDTTIPDPAAAPATATILRNDLVANTIPALRTALETLTAAINSLLTEASTSDRGI